MKSKAYVFANAADYDVDDIASLVCVSLTIKKARSASCESCKCIWEQENLRIVAGLSNWLIYMCDKEIDKQFLNNKEVQSHE